MTTFVATQNEFSSVLYALCELDYDAKEAYEAAIQRVENAEYKEKLMLFKKDHECHIEKITRLLQKHQKSYPEGPSAKQLLTKGKVIIAELAEDKAILQAMKSNEEDTNIAYDKVHHRDDMWPDAQELIHQGLTDEKLHKIWLENTLTKF